jgi:hypothetical protein
MTLLCSFELAALQTAAGSNKQSSNNPMCEFSLKFLSGFLLHDPVGNRLNSPGV